MINKLLSAGLLQHFLFVDEEDKEDVLHVYTGILLLLLLSRFSRVQLFVTP